MSQASSPPASGQGRRFIIMGLPRSGTTYLMTLLNSHKSVFCSGEQFNPYAIVENDSKVTDAGSVLERDRTPLIFMKEFFARGAAEGYDRVGFKFMIGHNIRVLDHILNTPDLTLIYVHRNNRLAQISSLIKATETKKWAQSHPDDMQARKIDVGPRQISQHWHEYATFDRLFAAQFRYLPHSKLQLEYRDMFTPGFNDRICAFLRIAPDPDMRSPLVKQSANTVLDRFKNPKPIRRYFTDLGLKSWLDSEL